MKNYSIYYRFDKGIVIVFRVLHQSRSFG
ncbi:type II toxin-antitoxin system RelE/ParE family toxin [Streptococcus pyogenes]|nr:type II toxin-antitoxin system RelE/ParE family toxin [Streptococcus pyogenes]WSE68975.1 type II toxin-antitoxin system RelE/ParE family toxin [Streptococcus pyogenes]